MIKAKMLFVSKSRFLILPEKKEEQKQTGSSPIAPHGAALNISSFMLFQMQK
jgi:hypothetical protein